MPKVILSAHGQFAHPDALFLDYDNTAFQSEFFDGREIVEYKLKLKVRDLRPSSQENH